MTHGNCNTCGLPLYSAADAPRCPHNGFHPPKRYRPTTAAEAAQAHERRLRDDVLDELVDWLSEEEGTHVAIRDVLEHINTIRTRKP